ncbi:GNAT family N-acetyltransferase [Arenicella sp.]|nr:GNAT family N-acetyltransferase [Arenicella sp.]
MSNVVTFYLEMTSPNSLHEKKKPNGFTVRQDQIKQYQLNRFLYQFIGEQWQWWDKLSWSKQQWQNYVERNQLKTYIAYFKGTIAGYYELEQQAAGNVEIVYLGLSPKFVGQGFGGYLLTHATKSAWTLTNVKRVWVHTCSLDHQSALKNYQARGFQVYQESTEEQPVD